MHLTRIVILPLFLRNAATWVMCSPSVANKPKALSAASWDWNICASLTIPHLARTKSGSF